jgi:hypothetical protein
MIHTLSNKIKQRKDRLSNFLYNNKEDISPEKHHQIHGALDEIDYILNILENHKKQEIEKENNPDDVFLFKPVNKKSLNLFDFVKGLF